MTWTNQNPFVSWMPRIGGVVLGASILLASIVMVASEGDPVFGAIVFAVSVPAAALAFWGSWRSVPIDAVTVDSADGTITVQMHRQSSRLSRSQVRHVTSYRGLVWIEARVRERGLFANRSFVLAQYDDALRELMRQVGSEPVEPAD